MFIAQNWKDYEVIDTSDKEKLERWGDYILVRPDPQVIWNTPKTNKGWKHMNAHYHRSAKGGGDWEFFDLPKQWQISYNSPSFDTPLILNLKPFSFKHTGLFPEQAANWDWFSDIIKNSGRPKNEVNVLNLFAYTGGATMAASAAGASVCHVDAAKGMVTWAKENAVLSGLDERPIRYIVDDVKKFVEREFRRGRKYDGIIMDPPSYGRGPGGEVWKIENELFGLIESCLNVMSDNPLFFLVNSYTTGMSGNVMSNIYKLTLCKKFGGEIDIDEIGLPVTNGGLVLPCGYSARWVKR